MAFKFIVESNFDCIILMWFPKTFLSLNQTLEHQGENKERFGKSIPVEVLEKDMTPDQQVQLYELMKETNKPAPQFMIKDEDK